MKETKDYECHKHFHDGRVSVSDDPRCGRPSTSTYDENIERVRNVELSDRRKSAQEISAEVVTPVGKVLSVPHEDLFMVSSP
jgi:hypothetical protein